MPTQIDICNQALDLLGAEPITDIDDQTVRAQACKRNYDAALRVVLEARQWTFAKVSASFTLGTTPGFGWDFAFDLPDDFVRLAQLNGVDYTGQPTDDWEIQGRTLLSDDPTADVVYVSTAADPSTYPQVFVEALAYQLALKMANALRQDGTSGRDELTQLYERALSKAGLFNAQQDRRPLMDAASQSWSLRSRWTQRR